ncbi:hypothetical protein [Rufibacter hautae]|uniref:Outer membrane protein beta-barrel domain-containing protein n=1 Tax=Rufibacter hautae TaxID=2595005 RepID=A0A5B6TEC1_9BACT|nr:hypothetical protein [Rufibacter hautae]KAA3437734.1 hypothetical protein FOA19_10550 [Rufibacter hautae]
MVKGTLLAVCLLSSVTLAWGQDLITRTDGVILKTKVVEVKPDIIRFRLFDSVDSLVYHISPQDVKSIQMADGTVKTMMPSAAPVTEEDEKKSFNYETEYGRNLLYFYLLDLLYANLAVAYERIIASGKIGLKFPVMIGLSKESDYYTYAFREQVNYGLGLEVNIYPERQGRFRYYVTPAIHYRSFDLYNFNYYNGSESPYEQGAMTTLNFKIGAYYQFSRFFLVSADTGIGFRIFHFPDTSEEQYPFFDNRFFVPANLNLGFRF